MYIRASAQKSHFLAVRRKKKGISSLQANSAPLASEVHPLESKETHCVGVLKRRKKKEELLTTAKDCDFPLLYILLVPYFRSVYVLTFFFFWYVCVCVCVRACVNESGHAPDSLKQKKKVCRKAQLVETLRCARCSFSAKNDRMLADLQLRLQGVLTEKKKKNSFALE